MRLFRVPFRVVLMLSAVAWSGACLAQAWQRWAHAGWLARHAGPFVWLESLPRNLQATDWRSPLLLALLPLAAHGAWCLLRARFRSPDKRQARS